MRTSTIIKASSQVVKLSTPLLIILIFVVASQFLELKLSINYQKNVGVEGTNTSLNQTQNIFHQKSLDIKETTGEKPNILFEPKRMTQPKHQTTHFSVPCSRQMNCDESEYTVHPLPIPQLNVSTTIQYWDDSIQAQLECDLRQWVYDAPSGTPWVQVQSSYVQVGCPWNCNFNPK